ncbi:hypothetical protein BRADI_1g68780v3 [Brachypodium distachyon]|uniref:Uncharacterized protein n=1 Tax=Brachypodium distachyon TaxID=15368 RepID=I1H7N9_BRADI|nr:hypothetical protein BRADI_1g68780v3 [Brachypodium distachyon]
MAFLTSILYISSIVAGLLIAATTAVAQTPTSSSPAIGVVTSNATVSAANGTVALSSSVADNSNDEYICYLCFRRNTMVIKRCPLYKDDCHIACLSSPSASPITSFLSRRALQPPGPDGRRPDNAGDWPGAEDCYVMKLYPDGSWKIVSVVDCYAVAGCQLACSYYDATITASKDDGAAAIVTTRRPPPRVAEFERCGDQ